MATNLALDDKLIVEAQRIGKHKTKKEAVNAALSEYVRRRKQLDIVNSSARLITILPTITKPNVAVSATHEGFGRHINLVPRFAE